MTTTQTKSPLFNDRTYDVLKQTAQYYLPGLGAFYFALAGIWGLPYGEQILGTITAVDVFLGVLLGISTRIYNKSDAKYDGTMVVNSADPDKGITRLEVDKSTEEIQNKDSLTIKVQDLNG